MFSVGWKAKRSNAVFRHFPPRTAFLSVKPGSTRTHALRASSRTPLTGCCGGLCPNGRGPPEAPERAVRGDPARPRRRRLGADNALPWQKITEIGKKGVCVLPAHRENAWSRSSPSGRAGPRRESRGAVLPISVIFCHKRLLPLPSQRWREPVLGGPEPVLPPVGRRGGPFRPTDRAIRGVGRTSRGAGAHRARRSGPACANPGLTKSRVSRAEPPMACARLPPSSPVERMAKGGDAVALRGAWARKRWKTKPEANNRCV